MGDLIQTHDESVRSVVAIQKREHLFRAMHDEYRLAPPDNHDHLARFDFRGVELYGPAPTAAVARTRKRRRAKSVGGLGGPIVSIAGSLFVSRWGALGFGATGSCWKFPVVSQKRWISRPRVAVPHGGATVVS